MKFSIFSSILLTLLSPGLILAAEKSKSSEDPDGRLTKLEEVRMTAYTHTESDHVKYGRKNAIGTRLRLDDDYSSVAADWSIFPLGTKFKMEGKDTIFVVDDYGSALVGKDTLDIYTPSKRAMNQWGVRYKDIEIIEFGDYVKSREILSQRKGWRHCRKMLAAIDSMPNPLPAPGVPMLQPAANVGETMLANVEPVEPKPPTPDLPKEAPTPAPEALSDPDMAPVPDPDVFLASLDAATLPQPEPAPKPVPAVTVTAPAPAMELASYTPVAAESAHSAHQSVTLRKVRPLTNEEASERVVFRQRSFTPLASL